MASKNKANCSKQTLKHTGGTKSFARHRDEEVYGFIILFINLGFTLTFNFVMKLTSHMDRLEAGLMGVYLIGRISSFAPIVGRTGLMLMRNQQKTLYVS